MACASDVAPVLWRDDGRLQDCSSDVVSVCVSGITGHVAARGRVLLGRASCRVAQGRLFYRSFL